VLALSLLALASCGGESPTEPPGNGPADASALDLTGKWSGTVTIRGADLAAGMTLVDADGRTTGEMTDWEGVTWTVEGNAERLYAGRIPRSSTCSVLGLSIDRVVRPEDVATEISGGGDGTMLRNGGEAIAIVRRTSPSDARTAKFAVEMNGATARTGGLFGPPVRSR